jgi:uncharacterized membrane protein (DUF373 family)
MAEDQPAGLKTDHLPPVLHAAETKLVHSASRIFLTIEQLIYIVLGAILALTAMLALAGTTELLWAGFQNWTGTTAVIEVMDRLLFVLMLIEILYTIRASLQSGTLSPEPFLIVGLIACIRRILVISLENSDIAQPAKWSAERAELFQAAMIELGVLAFLIIVMVAAIYLVRRHKLS